MKNGMRSLVCALMVLAAIPARAAIEVRIKAHSAPNLFGSPSAAAYIANVMTALQTGGASPMSRETDPTGFEFLESSYDPCDIMVTSFPSWRCQADPPAPFGAELGNRMHFAVIVETDGTEQFRLKDIQFSVLSSDGYLNYIGNLAGVTFNGTTRIGVDFGPNRVEGGGDDIVYDSNEGDAVLVDKLVYFGFGNAYWPGGPGDPFSGQMAIDATEDYILDAHVVITAGYTVTTASGFGSATVSLEPPGTELLINGFETGDLSAWDAAVPGPEPLQGFAEGDGTRPAFVLFVSPAKP